MVDSARGEDNWEDLTRIRVIPQWTTDFILAIFAVSGMSSLMGGDTDPMTGLHHPTVIRSRPNRTNRINRTKKVARPPKKMYHMLVVPYGNKRLILTTRYTLQSNGAMTISHHLTFASPPARSLLSMARGCLKCVDPQAGAAFTQGFWRQLVGIAGKMPAIGAASFTRLDGDKQEEERIKGGLSRPHGGTAADVLQCVRRCLPGLQDTFSNAKSGLQRGYNSTASGLQDTYEQAAIGLQKVVRGRTARRKSQAAVAEKARQDLKLQVGGFFEDAAIGLQKLFRGKQARRMSATMRVEQARVGSGAPPNVRAAQGDGAAFLAGAEEKAQLMGAAEAARARREAKHAAVGGTQPSGWAKNGIDFDELVAANAGDSSKSTAASAPGPAPAIEVEKAQMAAAAAPASSRSTRSARGQGSARGAGSARSGGFMNFIRSRDVAGRKRSDEEKACFDCTAQLAAEAAARGMAKPNAQNVYVVEAEGGSPSKENTASNFSDATLSQQDELMSELMEKMKRGDPQKTLRKTNDNSPVKPPEEVVEASAPEGPAAAAPVAESSPEEELGALDA